MFVDADECPQCYSLFGPLSQQLADWLLVSIFGWKAGKEYRGL